MDLRRGQRRGTLATQTAVAASPIYQFRNIGEYGMVKLQQRFKTAVRIQSDRSISLQDFREQKPRRLGIDELEEEMLQESDRMLLSTYDKNPKAEDATENEFTPQRQCSSHDERNWNAKHHQVGGYVEDCRCDHVIYIGNALGQRQKSVIQLEHLGAFEVTYACSG